MVNTADSEDSAAVQAFLADYRRPGQSDLELADRCHDFGGDLYSRNKNEPARLCFREALRLRLGYYRGNRLQKPVLRAYCMIGATYNEQQNYHEALLYLDSAKAWLPEAAVKPHIFMLMNTGQAYFGITELKRAQASFQAARDSMAVHRNDVPEEWPPRLLKMYASCARQLGNDSLALRLTEEGAALPGLSKDRKADFEALSANILQDSMLKCPSPGARKFVGAQSMLHIRRAMALYKKLADVPGLVRTAGNFSELYRRAGQPDVSVALLTALVRDTASIPQTLLASPHITLGEAYFDLGKPDLALVHYDLALASLHPERSSRAALSRLPLPRWPAYFYTLSNIAKTHLYRYTVQGQADGREKSVAAYNSLAQMAKLMRSELVSETAKFDLAGKMQTPLSNAVGMCRRLYTLNGEEEYKQRAFAFSEQSKAFALIEAVHLKNLGITSFDQPRRQALATTELSVDTIQNLLAPDQALLSYFMEDTTLHIFLLRKDAPLQWESVSVRREVLANMAARFDTLIQAVPENDGAYKIRDEALGNLGYALYRLLLAPVEKYRLPERLVIIPSAPFQGLSFEALSPRAYAGSLSRQVQDANFVLFQHSVSYAISAGMWKEMTGGAPDRNLSSEVAAFAPAFNPVLQVFRPLPNREEITAIAKVAPEQVYCQQENTKEAFWAASRRYGILHVSTHGIVNSHDPNQNYIVFDQPGTTVDSAQLLHLYELYNRELPQQLIVLAACETGAGRYVTGEGILSIAYGLSYAGAHSFMATLWPIKSDVSLRIMPEFYKKILRESMPKDRALAAVKRAYVYEHPTLSNWAGLTLNGNSRPLRSAEQAWPWAWLILPGVVLTALLWWRRRTRKPANES